MGSGTGAQWDRIVRLDDSITLDSFECGEPEIDIWFHRDSIEWQEEGQCTVYVAMASTNDVVGFFSLNAYYLQKRTLPDNTKEGLGGGGNIPTVLLGRFGVDKRFRGQHRADGGYPSQGPLLIRKAIGKAKEISEQIGCRLLYVQALKESLIPWYQRQGFHSLPKNPSNLVLDLKRIEVEPLDNSSGTIG